MRILYRIPFLIFTMATSPHQVQLKLCQATSHFHAAHSQFNDHVRGLNDEGLIQKCGCLGGDVACYSGSGGRSIGAQLTDTRPTKEIIVTTSLTSRIEFQGPMEDDSNRRCVFFFENLC